MWADKPEGALNERNQGKEDIIGQGLMPASMMGSSNDKGIFDRGQDQLNFNKATKAQDSKELIQEEFQELRQGDNDKVSTFQETIKENFKPNQ